MANVKVLLVEDDVSLSNETAEILRQEGFEVVVSDSSVKALELISNDHYDAIVVDLVLKDGDAFPILDKLRTSNQQMPVVVATQYLPQYIREISSFFKQVKLIVPKPYPAASLAATVSALAQASN